MLSKDTEACFVVGRQDRLSQNFFQTQEPTRCRESEPPLCKVCLVTVKDRNLFHDASIHDGKKLREVLATLGVPGPDEGAVPALVDAADPIGLADAR